MGSKVVKTRIKQGDNVVILAGKDKGKTGNVKKVLRKDNVIKVLVEGAQLVKEHQRPNPQTGQSGGIVTKEAPIHVSNVALVDSEGKPRRVNIKPAAQTGNEKMKKIRCYRSQGELVEFGG